MALPGALVPWVESRFLKVTADGLVPNAGGFVEFRQTDLTTLQATYSDSTLTTPNANPIQLDDDGRSPDPIYLLPTGYSVFVYDSDMVLLYSVNFVEDVGSAFLSTQANIQAQGSTQSVSPYVVDNATDNLVVVDSATNPFIVTLPAASVRGTQLVIKNLSAGVVVRVTPLGADTIDGINAYYAVPAAVSPLFPTVILLSDGVSNWWIVGGIGI